MSAQELPIPPSSQLAPHANEVLRVWINADKNMDVTLIPAFADPGAWGLLLVDIARHVARAYANEGHNEEAVLDSIRQLFIAEWERPTDIGRTSAVDRQ